MTKDLRDSLTLLGTVLAIVAIIWVLIRLDPLRGIFERVPADWQLVANGALAVWLLAQVGWGLWQRRAYRKR